MDWLNYHHLFYFWTVARHGSVSRASAELHLTQPTLSTQIQALERMLGEKLLVRSGRGVLLTHQGQIVYRYASEIFSIGRELVDAMRGHAVDRPPRFVVGVADVLPKLIAYRLIKPALRLPGGLQVICREGKPDRLLSELALHGLDLVLSDSPIPPTVKIKAFSHLLGECGITVLGTAKLAKRYRRRFPRSLNGAPCLLPADNTMLRRSLDQWAFEKQLRLQVAGEFEDSALLKVFGQSGMGLLFCPTAIEREVCHQYGVRIVGRIDSIRERLYAISVDRKFRHPAIAAITTSAAALFS